MKLAETIAGWLPDEAQQIDNKTHVDQGYGNDGISRVSELISNTYE
ncbi:MAG: hypothetical protein LAT57_11490 [Balneolales bacterium]|nr:hypothetical protein [Balneolales bacterium]